MNDLIRMVRRNKLVGIWAAEKLGLVGDSAKAYSDDLASGTFDHNRNDVLKKVRNDFDSAGVVYSDDQILDVMSKLWLEAGTQGNAGVDASDAALIQIVRDLQLR